MQLLTDDTLSATANLRSTAADLRCEKENISDTMIYANFLTPDLNWTRFVTKRQSSWLRAALKLAKSKESAEDIVQEAIYKTLRSKANFSGWDHVDKYVTKAIRTVAMDAGRRSRKGIVAIAGGRAAHIRTPLEVLLAQEDEQRKQKLCEAAIFCLGRLSQAQRQAIELLVLNQEPLSLTEISRRICTPISTLRSRMLSGLRKMQRCISCKSGVKV